MLDPAVLGALLALDQPPFFEAFEDIGGIGAVQAEFMAECFLVQAGRGGQGGQHAVLHRRNIESLALLEEYGEMNLVQAADQKAGA